MKTGNVFRIDLPCQAYNLSLVSRVFEHNYIFAIEGDVT